MSNNGYGSQFAIYRKRVAHIIPFYLYLNGPYSGANSWENQESAEDAYADNEDGQLAPHGYFFTSGDGMTGNMEVNGLTITKFTIGVALSHNELNANGGIIYGLFGSTHYPRMYFKNVAGDFQLICEIKLDGVVQTLIVTGVGSFIKAGQPSFIVFRGSVTDGLNVLIDNVVRATSAVTGTAYNVGTGDFAIGTDPNQSYDLAGAIRGVYVAKEKLTDEQLETWLTMLRYEGIMDVYKDDFEKWNADGENIIISGIEQFGTSPYLCTLTED